MVNMLCRAGALVLLVLFAVGCGQGGTATSGGSAGYPAALVGPTEFAAARDQPARVTVNVHVPFEGDIPGTDLSVPYDELRAQSDRLPPTGTPLAVYCRSGSMSAEAVPVLAQMGYDDIVELDGGMLAWTKAGRPLLGQRQLE